MIAHLPAIDADVSLTTRRIVLYTFDILRTVLRTAHPLTERILRRNIKTSRIYGYLQFFTIGYKSPFGTYLYLDSVNMETELIALPIL